MKELFKKAKLAKTLAAFGFLSLMGTVQAALFEIDFTTAGAFSGQAGQVPNSPGSNTVFATALFADAGAGQVTLTMNVLNNLSAGAYVNDWYFNVSSAPLSGITFVPGGVQALNVENGVDAFKADGTGGDFDFAFHFNTSNPGQLAQGSASVYALSGTGITASSFNAFSVNAGPGGPYVSAVHVQGYQENGGSVWIGGTSGGGGGTQIPEPATLALIGLGLFGIAATRRCRT
jgi:hypothetical protein